VIESPLLAKHFTAEINRLWKGAELGITARLERKQARLRKLCGGLSSGSPNAVQNVGDPAKPRQNPPGLRGIQQGQDRG